MRNKIFNSFDEAVADIPDGACIGMDSWGVSVTPHNLVAAIRRKGIRDLTIITHCFVPMVFSDEYATMPSVLLPQMKKLIAPIVGVQRLGAGTFLKEYMEKGLEVELASHGTLCSRLYAGAFGLGGFYEPIGVGTILEEGKEKRVIDGKEYLFEKPLKPDYAFIRAYRADRTGNLVYRGMWRGNHPIMAMAAKVTIVEADKIVEGGEIAPEHVLTPGIFVDRIVEIPKDGLATPGKLKELIHQLGEFEVTRKLMFRERKG